MRTEVQIGTLKEGTRFDWQGWPAVLVAVNATEAVIERGDDGRDTTVKGQRFISGSCRRQRLPLETPVTVEGRLIDLVRI